ncbi:MbtH protein [Crossiella equi]|uniref:MbtH protein n=1 Tax=Crossiella equi TaxID=130796 RepID=A0ABS5ACI7_9PSEU|nr:MbtH family NRPS accessory protein [Crossiella equi]MBP2474296.1 MbtH protein [Crossiella equi]
MSELKFAVVRNDEEQHSVWPEGRELPAGWQREGFTGSRQECLDHIESVWTDIRPRSVRERLANS